MRVLVTGASGFLGRFLCQALTRRGDEVVALESRSCDLRVAHSLDAFNGGSFDFIYHLAAWTQAGEFCLHHRGEQWLNNQAINTNVLMWWSQFQPQAKLVSIGTSCSYDPAYELSEEHYLVGTPIESLCTYAMTKRMLHIGEMALSQQFGLSYLAVVPSTLYGPGYHTDGRQMHFIFDLIRKIVRGKLLGDRVVLWGDGHQRREVVLVHDFTRILLRLASQVERDLVNVGAGEDHEIRHFAQMISDHVGYDASRIEYDTSRYVGARSKCLGVTKLRSLIPNFQLTPLSEGLAETIDWYCRTMSDIPTAV